MTITKHSISDDVRLYITHDTSGVSSIALVCGGDIIPMTLEQSVMVADLILGIGK